jgi:4,5-dihydroxyphthalate decarboxylase
LSTVAAAPALSVGLTMNARTRPLIDGRVRPAGLPLTVSGLPIGELFWRQLKFADFDVSEMSISSLAIATSRAPTEWVALPVFTMRSFFHTGILVRTDAGIAAPADLRGKRFGVLEYQQTSVVWIRGWLEHEHGIRAQDVEWFMQRSPERSHGGSTGFRPPDGVRLSYVPPSTTIGEMIVKGDLDVLPFYPQTGHDLIDRSSLDLAREARVRPLFPDVAGEARRYHAQTGIFPVNHCVVVRRALLDRDPSIAGALLDTFIAANDLARVRGASLASPVAEVGLLAPDAGAALAADPLAYGVKANRPTLDALLAYIHEQGLSSRRVAIDELFAASILDR